VSRYDITLIRQQKWRSVQHITPDWLSLQSVKLELDPHVSGRLERSLLSVSPIRSRNADA
jgi:hypothetical protein